MTPFPELPFSLALCPSDEWRRNGKQHSEKHITKAQDVRAQKTLHNYLLLAHSPFSPRLSHRALMLLTENDSPLLIAHLELNPNPEHIQHLLPTLTCSCFNCLRGGEVTSASQAKILWVYARGPENKLSNVLFLHQFHFKFSNVYYYCRNTTNKRHACVKISRSSKWDAGAYQPCDLWHKGRTHIVPFCSRPHSSGQFYPVTFSFTCVPASVSTSQWWER